MAHFSREFRAHAPVANFWRLKFSEMQSSTFWMQMPGSLRKKTLRQKGGGKGPGHSGPTLNLPLIPGA